MSIIIESDEYCYFETDEELFQRNMDFWSEKNFDLAIRVRKLKDITSKIVYLKSDVTTMNLLVDGKLFWKEDIVKKAESFTRSKTQPRAMGEVSIEEISNYSCPANFGIENKLVERLKNLLAKNQININNLVYKEAPAACTIIFGLGLGHILNEFVKRTECKNIFIVEESIYFIYHSFFIFDYSELNKEIEKREGSFDINICDFDHSLQDKVADYLRYNLFPYIHSAKLLPYNMQNGVEFIKKFHGTKSNSLAGTKGFIYDDFLMIRQQAENLFRNKVPILSKFKDIHSVNVPCFIIGNGPSLEKAIDTIRKYQDQAIIISCGSTLRSLLVRGIKPDIQVEIENHILTFKIHEDINKEYDVSDILFFGSSTVHPYCLKIYPKAFTFIRKGMFRFNHDFFRDSYLDFAEPVVANTAMAVAVKFGFKDVYLFGVDCGTIERDETKPFHVSGSVYDKSTSKKVKLDENKKFLNYALKANFGGDARSTTLMMLSVPYLESVPLIMKHLYRVNYYNCSDGVYLKGYVPKLAETISLDTNKEMKLASLDFINDQKMLAEEDPLKKVLFCNMFNPENIYLSEQMLNKLIDEYLELPKEDTLFPLFKLFKNIEQYFEAKGEYEGLDYSLVVINNLISGSCFQYFQYYLAVDCYLPGHLRREWAKDFLLFFKEDMLGTVKKEYLQMCDEFADLREKYLSELAEEEAAISPTESA